MHQARTPAKDPSGEVSLRHRLFTGRTAAAASLTSPNDAPLPSNATHTSGGSASRGAKEALQSRSSSGGSAYHAEAAHHGPHRSTKNAVTSVPDAALACDGARAMDTPLSAVTPERLARCPANVHDVPASASLDAFTATQCTPTDQLTRQRRRLSDSCEEAVSAEDPHLHQPSSVVVVTPAVALGYSPPTLLSRTLAGTAALLTVTEQDTHDDVNLYTPDVQAITPRAAVARVGDADGGAGGTVDGDGDMSSAGETPAPFPVTPQRPEQVRFFRSSKPLLREMEEDPFGAEFPAGGVTESPSEGPLYCVGQLHVGPEEGSDGDNGAGSDERAAGSRGGARGAPAARVAAGAAAPHMPRVFSVSATLQDEDAWPSHNTSLLDNDAEADRGSSAHLSAPPRAASPALSAQADTTVLEVRESSSGLANTGAADAPQDGNSPPAQPPLERDAAPGAALATAEAQAGSRRNSASSPLALSHIQLEERTPGATHAAHERHPSEPGEPANSAARPDSRKRVSPSSGRGTSGSLGCTDASGDSPESHERRSSNTPLCEAGTDSEERGSCPPAPEGGLLATTQVHRRYDGCSHSEAPHRGLSIEDVAAVVGRAAADRVRVPTDAGAGAVQHPPSAEGAAVTVSGELYPCGDITNSLASLTPAGGAVTPLPLGPWSSALHSGQALVAEHHLEVLRAYMTAQPQSAAAWLPSIPLSGLGALNAHAHTPAPATVLPPADESAEVPPPHSELQLLFNLYCSSRISSSQPAAAAEALCAAYFATQLRRYDNWVHHLQFEFLYVRMVAFPAVGMMELHQRRLTCMRRDLGVRDAIELFVLLAPRPRAPAVSTSRGIFSAFRMALHALSRSSEGTSSERRTSLPLPPPPPPARSSSARRKSSSSSSTKPTTRTDARPANTRTSVQQPLPQSGQPEVKVSPLQPTTTAALAGAGQVPAVEDEGQPRCPPRIESLIASERCNRAVSSSPVITEMDARAVSRAAPVNSTEPSGGVRERIEDTEPPRESVSRQRSAPRPLNKTYSEYYRRVAERNADGAPLASPAVSSPSGSSWLPELPRSSSRAACRGSAAPCRSSTSPATRPAYSAPSTRKAPAPGRVKELPNGGLRAKERVVPKRRNRTPPPPPTDADFIDLNDAAVLDRFVR